MHNCSFEKALERDNHRCPLSTSMNTQYFLRLSKPERVTETTSSATARARIATPQPTFATHIIPHKLNGDFSRSIWSILDRRAAFGIDELRGQQIDRLDNIITLADTIYTFCFSEMTIWLKHIEVSDYCQCSYISYRQEKFRVIHTP